MVSNLKNSLNHLGKDSRAEHWDKIWSGSSPSWGGYYHRWIQRVYGFVIPKGARVLELGCGCGDLLASLHPDYGVGIDFSPAAISKARINHTDLHFDVMDAESLELSAEQFDYIILSDLVNDLCDVQTTLRGIIPHCHPFTRLVINFHSHLWRLPLQMAQRLRLATPSMLQNWITIEDVRNFLILESFELLNKWSEIVVPLNLPGASWFNRYLAKVAPFRWFALTNLVVARPLMTIMDSKPSCTVVVAARNEQGNINELFERLLDLELATEIIFIEGNSTDNTFLAIKEAISDHPSLNCRLLKQPGEGKGDAVRKGFAVAMGDVLMILDADMTVLPEDLRLFYEAIVSRKGEFINGVRLVYPMEDKAMGFFNLVGNKFFSIVFSWLLDQPIRDTLCGTKVFWRKDYERIAADRDYFGNFDPFGDFDLLFGAAKLKLKILEIPVHYYERHYGETNISRWHHGFLLLKMTVLAARRIKFF